MSGVRYGGGGIFDEDSRYMSEFTKDEIADVLTDASAYIAEHGWMQGDFWNPTTGRVCALGAMKRVLRLCADQNPEIYDPVLVKTQGPEVYQAAMAANRHRRSLYHATKNALRQCLSARHLIDDDLVDDIETWNDRNGQTAETVREVMSDCANRTRENNDNTEAAS